MKIYLFIGFLISTLNCYSQNQANIWYFGEFAGLDFNNGAPFPLNNSAMNQLEGCASIADCDGNLLFYTNGITVWNRNHIQMPNGNDLMGNQSSTQSALITPYPLNDSLYYIFTVDICNPCISLFGVENNGLRYSVVNINLDSGLGDVVEKNILLFQPCTEKLAATHHENGIDIWITAHEIGTNAFYTYSITESGLNTIPVISNVGTPHSVALPQPWANVSAGQLKFSPDGGRIAAVIRDINIIEIFDFDKSSGLITNPITIPSSKPYDVYGIEFSGNSSKLYYTSAEESALHQLDISQEGIANSWQIITDELIVNSFGALQLGLDGRIYVARYREEFLGVINLPNQSGIGCNYQNKSVYLGGNLSSIGLPNVVSTYLQQTPPAIIGDTLLCANSEAMFYAQLPECTNQTISWEYLGIGQSSTNALSVSIENNGTLGPDTLILFATDDYGQVSDSIIIHYQSLPVTNLGMDTLICPDSALILSAGSSEYTYEWNDGKTGPVRTITEPGRYWVSSMDSLGCVNSDTITVQLNESCVGDSIINQAIQNVFYSSDHRFEIESSMVAGRILLKVYNRWGKILYKSSNYINNWSPALELPSGVYYYTIGTSTGTVAHKGFFYVITQ